FVEKRVEVDPRREKIVAAIEKIRERLHAQREAKRIALDTIKDKRLVEFFHWLEEHGLADDVVVIGGGVRDAYTGGMLNDLDVTIKIPLTDEERFAFAPTTSQANERVYHYVMERLERLAAALGVPVQDFLPPLGDKKIMWRGKSGELEVQYSGPIKLNGKDGDPIYLKRLLVNADTRAMYSSNTGPALLHLGLDHQGGLYGRVAALDDFDQGIVRVAGDGNNFAIGNIIRLLRLKYQYGLQILEDDEALMRETIRKYNDGELPLPDVILKGVVERQMDRLVATARNPAAAMDELEELGIYELLTDRMGLNLEFSPDEVDRELGRPAAGRSAFRVVDWWDEDSLEVLASLFSDSGEGSEAEGASSPAPLNPGGIALNANRLELETTGERAKSRLPVDDFAFLKHPIEGFSPIIFEITPATNLPLMMGFPEN
ncbi:MAG: hypothetical protein NUV91_01475, partial [Candidatus Omnitrophica bacterium]|nr:hypothetical protein [Candidatus Omnitrophota bacterium]